MKNRTHFDVGVVVRAILIAQLNTRDKQLTTRDAHNFSRGLQLETRDGHNFPREAQLITRGRHNFPYGGDNFSHGGQHFACEAQHEIDNGRVEPLGEQFCTNPYWCTKNKR